MPKRHIAVYLRKQYIWVCDSWCESTLFDACSHHDPHHAAPTLDASAARELATTGRWWIAGSRTCRRADINS